ncbi:hypothetical protein ACFWM7_01250 [Streptomyces sp. NPDC058375]|uniref:hypothetical protein n=1 Tax=Streptomyces sp. NPDC058375 TaxID=3346467 RepID=UPI00364EED70
MTDSNITDAQENEATGTYGTATVCDVELRVKPANQWRPSYIRALREGDYDAWAAGVLHADDVQTFIDLDPTFDEINEFTSAAMETTGDTAGKSSGRARSSRSTRKR